MEPKTATNTRPICNAFDTHPPRNSSVWPCECTTPTARPHTSIPCSFSTATCAHKRQAVPSESGWRGDSPPRATRHCRRGLLVANKREALAGARLAVTHKPDLWATLSEEERAREGVSPQQSRRPQKTLRPGPPRWRQTRGHRRTLRWPPEEASKEVNQAKWRAPADSLTR